MQKILAALLLLFITHSSYAQTRAERPVRAEILVLLNALQTSGCEFKRNGRWYSGAQAKTHLLRKLDYIEGKGTLQSAEQFIALAASQSSFSGKPYQVRCAGGAPVDSQLWLTRQLDALRAKGSGG